MSDPLTDADDDASTPLTPDERAALIPSYVTLRSELNEIEQIGIDRAVEWATARRRGDVLDEAFLCQLHTRMFGDVWTWAGTFSKESKRGIGVDGWEIGPRLALLHNHPSGDRKPSAADIDMTHQVIEAGKALRIPIHDHVVVGSQGLASFKALGLM